jgi:hypothetical protein
MLWKADDANLHLLASIHLLDQAGSTLYPEAELAYSSAQRVTFEHDMTATPDSSLVENSSGNPLSGQVPDAVFRNAAREWANLGLAPDRLEQLQPWIVAFVIGARLAAQRGITEAHGVDKSLWGRAAADGKTRTTLESPAEALSTFANAPLHEQASFLDYATNPVSNLQDDLDLMVRSWHRHDEAAFVRIRAHRLRMWPEGYEKAITGRNHIWLPGLLQLVADKVPALVVVGALHCVGEEGLPNLLTKAGWRLSRVV